MAKRVFGVIVLLLCMLVLPACMQDRGEPYIVRTMEATSLDAWEEVFAADEERVLKTYYEMSDGSWKTGEYSYAYRLEITGRLNNAVKDITYVILSNTEDISFEQAWKASWLSSNLEDYFQPEDAVIVGIS